MFKTIIGKAIIAVVLSVVLAAPVFSSETAGQYLDDVTVGTKTKAALLDNETVSGLNLNVEVYKGNVQLSGFVETDAEKKAALSVAEGVKGAKKVLDAIVVLEGSRTMGETVDDTTIHAKLKTALADVEGFSKAVAVNTVVRQGHVLLAGFVEKESVKKAAGEVAKGITGVKKVHNLTEVMP